MENGIRDLQTASDEELERLRTIVINKIGLSVIRSSILEVVHQNSECQSEEPVLSRYQDMLDKIDKELIRRRTVEGESLCSST